MTVTKPMNIGVTGLKAHEQAMGVVGDNIANVNTIGFKHSRARFEDVMGSASNLRGQSGLGVRTLRTQQIFTQGSLKNTGVTTDLALSGSGFFVVQGNFNGQAGQFYTRNGQLSLLDGELVTSNGMNVMGYPAAPGGGFDAKLAAVDLSSASLPPQPTSELEIVANLDANETPPAGPFDVNDPGATSSFSTSVTVYDNQGTPHALDVFFVKGANPNEWDIHVLADASELTTPAPANAGDIYTEVASGTATFDGNGLLQTLPAMSASIQFNNSAAQTIDLNLGEPTAAGGTGMLGLTQYGSPSSINAQSQDGYAADDLNDIEISSDGIVSGIFSNGQTLPMWRLAVATLQGQEGLARAGGNLWAQTTDSGEPAIGGAAVGGRAAVISGALEQSTVDLTTQFVDMITYQRAFQASAKFISTVSDLLDILVNL